MALHSRAGVVRFLLVNSLKIWICLLLHQAARSRRFSGLQLMALMVLGFRVCGWSKLGSEASRDNAQPSLMSKPSPTSIARLVTLHIQLGRPVHHAVYNVELVPDTD
jgi:hypothetical protein